MTAAGTGQGFGAVSWWGFSPALDFQQKCLTVSMEHLNISENNIPDFNILMVGEGGDSRHLLKTISQARRWPCRRISFYVVENNLELIGRHLLFLALALEPPDKMGLQEKSELYLELHGNSLIRSQTAAYLQEKAQFLIKCITNLDYFQCRLPAVDVSALKFKERDQLEAIFKFWRNPDLKIFQMDKMWDLRNRQYLTASSSYRSLKGQQGNTQSCSTTGAKEIGDTEDECQQPKTACVKTVEELYWPNQAFVIGRNEYFKWREKGVAFEIREGIYDIPNKSIASGLLLRHKGEKIPARGYWGDIVTGPYIAFGIESEEKSLLETRNGIHVKSAQDISQYNITALFHELVNGSCYTLPSSPEHSSQANICEVIEEEEEGSSLNNMRENKEETQTEESQSQAKGGGSNSEYDFFPLDNVRVHFLPVNCIQDLHKKMKFERFFNVTYFSCSMVQHVTPKLKLISAPKATLIVELAR
ncbi:dynein axonemal assembly factor 3 [Protopterus annectens]|uniref:dynein axonemal assembly factor 3 n=1 Tax=Protopterus annectens TaxID=7888 RepID=UPI001CFC3426|nr:dynein axonemal assembly factor 3 [Protopterus annectens]